MPTTTIASTEKAIVIARMFVQVRKCGLAKDMMMNSVRMMSTRPVSRAPNRRDKRLRSWAIVFIAVSRTGPSHQKVHQARRVS